MKLLTIYEMAPNVGPGKRSNSLNDGRKIDSIARDARWQYKHCHQTRR